MEQCIATAVNKEPFSIKKMLCNCLPFSNMLNNAAGPQEFEDEEMNYESKGNDRSG